MPSHSGPDLPYSVVAGVTPCAPGWLVASAKLHGATFAPESPRVLGTFAEVLDERPSFSVIALNAPVGYIDESVQAEGHVIGWLAPCWGDEDRPSTMLRVEPAFKKVL
jgi:hypothetical protein